MGVTRPVPSPGELGVLWLVSPGLREGVPRGLVREPMETCAVEDACSPPPRHGGGGTGRSTPPRRGMPCAQPLLPLVSQLSSWPRVTRSRAFLRFLLSCQTRSSPSPGPRTHQGFQKHPWSRCYAGGQPEPVEAGPWWSRGKVLHLDRGGFQEAGLSLRNLAQG